MNAASFFNESDYERLKDIVDREEVINCIETPFRRKHKENGNIYELTISTGYYHPSIYNGAYRITCMDSYNYKSEKTEDFRNIGGSSHFVDINLTSFDAFMDCINSGLRRFPDYKESEEPIQMRFF